MSAAEWHSWAKCATRSSAGSGSGLRVQGQLGQPSYRCAVVTLCRGSQLNRQHSRLKCRVLCQQLPYQRSRRQQCGLCGVICCLIHPFSSPHVLVQTPAEEDRAAPYKPKAALLYTGGNSTAAAELSAGLLPGPALTAASLIAAQRYLEGFQADLGSGAAAVPGGCHTWLGGLGISMLLLCMWSAHSMWLQLGLGFRV